MRRAGPSIDPFAPSSVWSHLLADAAGTLLTRCERAASDALRHPRESTHRFRKTLRRLRSLVRFSRGAIDEAVLRRCDGNLRESFRAAGAVRDRDVLLQRLAELGRTAQPDPAVRLARRKVRDTPLGEIPQLSWECDFVRLAVHEFVSSIPSRLSIVVIEDGLAGAQRGARRALARYDRKATDPNLHDLRKRMKEWRDAVVLLEPLAGASSLCSRETASSICRWLGDATDWILVERLLETLVPDDGVPPLTRLRSRVRRRRQTAERRGVTAAREQLAVSPRGFAGRWVGVLIALQAVRGAEVVTPAPRR